MMLVEDFHCKIMKIRQIYIQEYYIVQYDINPLIDIYANLS